MLQHGVDAVLPLGDTQYENGELSDYMASYDPTWGRFKSISRPAVGNHEYNTPGAVGYFDYFNGVGYSNGLAGARDKGYYSYDLGSWHLVSLNANCGQIGGCGAGSAQEQWLRADLAAHPRSCVLAYDHQPRFSSGASHGNDPQLEPLWQALYDAGAELFLSGHDHDYERFAPQTPSGQADSARGIRQFVVGTGGKNLGVFGSVQPNSEARVSDTVGVLELKLDPESYEWRLLGVGSQTPVDSGYSRCH